MLCTHSGRVRLKTLYWFSPYACMRLNLFLMQQSLQIGGNKFSNLRRRKKVRRTCFRSLLYIAFEAKVYEKSKSKFEFEWDCQLNEMKKKNKRSENDFSLPCIWQCNTIRTARVSDHKTIQLHTTHTEWPLVGTAKAFATLSSPIHFHSIWSIVAICDDGQQRSMSMWNMIR